MREWRWVVYVTVGTILGWSLVYAIYPNLEISFIFVPIPIVVVYVVRLIVCVTRSTRGEDQE